MRVVADQWQNENFALELSVFVEGVKSDTYFVDSKISKMG